MSDPSIRRRAQRLIVLFAGCAMCLGALGAASEPVAGLAGPYLGQQPPGPIAIPFAPGVVSVEGRYEYGVSFAPGGEHLLFTAHEPDAKTRIMQSVVREGRWTEPSPVSLANGARRSEMEAFFSPDGKYVYFAPYDEGMDVRIWRVEVDGTGWKNPQALAGAVAEDAAFYPTTDQDGTLFYTNIVKRKSYQARQLGNGEWSAAPVPVEFGGHAFVAPDRSVLLVDARAEDSLGKGDIYASFPREDGGWTRPVNLGAGVNSEYGETCPSLSPDGKYLFFSRYNEEGGVSQIYWVDAQVIDTAREKSVVK